MVPANRVDLLIETSYVIIRGLLDRGISIHGPFNTYQEAVDYGGKNFPDDTREIIKMTKETITHGDST